MIAALLATAVCAWAGNQQALPDRVCTPGDRLDVVTNTNVQQTMCVPGWATAHRDVTAARRRAIADSYGITPPYFPFAEIDHLISLQLGGSNADRNLWPLRRDLKRAPRGKDDVEDILHARVCAGRMRLSTAQRVISGDWRKGRRYLP